MTDTESLEQYFDALLQQGGAYSDQHPLADMEKRFAMYRLLRKAFKDMSQHLALSGRVVYGKHHSYQALLLQFGQVFSSLAGMQDDQLDFYVRMLTVEEVKAKHAGVHGEHVPAGQILGYFVEGLLAGLFPKKDSIRMTAKSLIGHYAPPAFLGFLPIPWIQIWEDKKLKDWLKQAYIYYEMIEHYLLEARGGVIARDKKMLITLRSLKLNIGKTMVKALMGKDNNTVKSPDYLPPVIGMAKSKDMQNIRGS